MRGPLVCHALVCHASSPRLHSHASATTVSHRHLQKPTRVRGESASGEKAESRGRRKVDAAAARMLPLCYPTRTSGQIAAELSGSEEGWVPRPAFVPPPRAENLG
ncbi:hypothetical protein GOBAR_DD08634 [Gossypium barbadense]|nr:hypothetical protein GOBAR_DD08634 [Gossypium barbadense]